MRYHNRRATHNGGSLGGDGLLPPGDDDPKCSGGGSLGVMSMLGYAVGLGDRHLENLLIDATSGAAMHVDFGCLFDHGLNLEHPERVPFRLTQNLIHAMGVTGVALGVLGAIMSLKGAAH